MSKHATPKPETARTTTPVGREALANRLADSGARDRRKSTDAVEVNAVRRSHRDGMFAYALHRRRR